jgi:hypothetical protein
MIVVAGKYGRTGNQLWTHANVIAFCLGRQIPFYSLVFPEDENFMGRECGSALIRSCCVERSAPRSIRLRFLYKAALRIAAWPVVSVGDRAHLDLDACADELAAMASRRTVFMTGLYLFSPESVREQRAQLLSYFAPVPRTRASVDGLLARARAGGGLLVGVHMRRGDYRTYSDGLMYYEASEYAQVMRSIAARHGAPVKFLICSDEAVDPRDLVGLDAVVSDSGHLADMYALAGCDLIVGPDSTFSHWASFYGNVPIHILNYKAVEKYGLPDAVREPDPARDFEVFTPERFGAHIRKRVDLASAMLAPQRISA